MLVLLLRMLVSVLRIRRLVLILAKLRLRLTLRVVIVAATTRPNCVHANQRMAGGVWVCKLCGGEVRSEPTSPEDFGRVRFNGLANFRQFRDKAYTERQMTADNIKRFVANKGYDPVREDGKDRWI
jgi:hypothetical protein